MDDVVVTSYDRRTRPASARVFPVPLASALELEDATATLDNASDESLEASTHLRLVTPGDVDGDGLDDLDADGMADLAFISSFSTTEFGGEGAGELWYGPLVGSHATMTSTVTLPSSRWATHCGRGSTYSSSVAGLGDFTGNGASDLAVACLGYTGYTDAGEKAFVQAGVWIVPGLGM